MKKTWFITGASRGFGRIWAEAALTRGDRVTATARKLADVADLAERFGDTVLPLALDVTDPEQVRQVVSQAFARFGRLDVLVNNAGVSLLAAVEEASDEQIRDLFDANYLGMVRVLRAALPLLRQQGSGHILGVSSGLGIGSLPLIGFYSATKWAVEALHESLAQEVRPFGLSVTIVEPGEDRKDRNIEDVDDCVGLEVGPDLLMPKLCDESGDVMVAVSDSGTGFGLELDRVFNPFFTTKANGMGMGLSISRSLVESHGGRLWAAPNSPHGAVVSFTLPAAGGSPS
jgi:NAD(P)-dependent dehydrogenase (short-subunit alcohol dehydrogenase family)